MPLTRRIGGNEATFTYAKGATDTTLVFADVFEAVSWSAVIGFITDTTTPFGYSGVRRDVFLQDAQGTIEFLAAFGTKAPIPTGIVGTLTLTEISGNSRILPVIFETITMSPQAGSGNAQKFQYKWVLSAQIAGAPIT